ncbi:hypothetical protein C1Y40_05714 [Mycobacterium talmoniae]|uniref:Uncharacterized protein n=1 Tax=Mycobacterium talmoniae TaxID=1858794 RepID=A0A2S8BBT7_9MYCO|nr:hypothetical protein C1Y40_05714 [Mycobacterium talmoniae]
MIHCANWSCHDELDVVAAVVVACCWAVEAWLFWLTICGAGVVAGTAANADPEMTW